MAASIDRLLREQNKFIENIVAGGQQEVADQQKTGLLSQVATQFAPELLQGLAMFVPGFQPLQIFANMMKAGGVVQKTLKNALLKNLTGKATGVIKNPKNIKVSGPASYFFNQKNIDGKSILQGIQDSIEDSNRNTFLNNLITTGVGEVVKGMSIKGPDGKFKYKNVEDFWQNFRGDKDFRNKFLLGEQFGETPLRSKTLVGEVGVDAPKALESGIEDGISQLRDLNKGQDYAKALKENLLPGLEYLNEIGEWGKEVSENIQNTMASIKGKYLANDGKIPDVLPKEDIMRLDASIPKGNKVMQKGRLYFDQPQWLGQMPSSYIWKNGKLVKVYNPRTKTKFNI